MKLQLDDLILLNNMKKRYFNLEVKMKLVLAFVLLSFTTISHGLTLKVGVLAPDGTSWAINLKKM